jgi:hypothetical protein
VVRTYLLHTVDKLSNGAGFQAWYDKADDEGLALLEALSYAVGAVSQLQRRSYDPTPRFGADAQAVWSRPQNP